MKNRSHQIYSTKTIGKKRKFWSNNVDSGYPQTRREVIILVKSTSWSNRNMNGITYVSISHYKQEKDGIVIEDIEIVL